MSLTEMELSDSGGPGALKGFTYQNVAAAYYVLTMLEDKTLQSVRCEVVDDIDLIFKNKTVYIQVKTTTSDSNWSLKDLAEATTKKVAPVKPQRVVQTVSLEDSILHKSILCDKGKKPSQFKIITDREVTGALKYLRTPLATRNEKEALKGNLTKHLNSLIERHRPRKKPPFISPNGNGVEYWVQNAEWEVVSSQELLEHRCTKLILQCAHRKGIYLSANGDPERILCSLLHALFNKAKASRILNSVTTKTYHRKDFLPWFDAEIEHYTNLSKQHVKVYPTNNSCLQAILSEFFSNKDIYGAKGVEGEKALVGVAGEYHRKRYNYEAIANNLYDWFHEVLLLPSEIADHSPEKVTANFRTLALRYKKEALFINNLIAKALLHSVIRTKYKSQPIAASLHVDDGNNTRFDNIHIILNVHEPDTLLMGFSRLVSVQDGKFIESIVNEFDDLLTSSAFSSQKEKILIAKKDNYLLEHDINEVLAANQSLDNNLDRFRFVFFIGYESEHLECNSKNMPEDFKNNLILEATEQFKTLVDKLIESDDFYADLHIEAYLYPIPSLKSLISTVETQVKSQWTTL
ncbi:dsDNA nuclease domain-containing protein [Vibrio sp. RM-44-3]|uniref:dsDNA nuclease domain-containing protein n=1 Tax=Vibrio TaxID=662 RepID=UPI00215BB4FC|nr:MULTISPECIES: dsDNA nuclease domain-containing protein [Vibrio]ELB2854484.1 DUF4297 domain-containing protein [Vibrio alginolyticus]MDG2722495.1 dsDNA nuclease domain-containing protein [Vibrio parahaemolyticus]ELH9637724.1 DUF4297 domain-containing protein [Vibrio alginolyticus]EMA9139183.1 DUF4297 domain-containing protein [Vibrio alginolyticus]MCR9550629.1 dsDNA nuclease domain-containing protein [Vibrio sp. RM-41-2A]